MKDKSFLCTAFLFRCAVQNNDRQAYDRCNQHQTDRGEILCKEIDAEHHKAGANHDCSRQFLLCIFLIMVIVAYGKKFRCVLSPDEDEKAQWETIFNIHKGQGFCIEPWKDKIKIVDYFHGETLVAFAILSVVDTEEAVSGYLFELQFDIIACKSVPHVIQFQKLN